MAKRHHPDVDKTPGATDRFVRIQTAYEVLSDTTQRLAYDRTIPIPAAKPAAPTTDRVRTASYGGRTVEDPNQAPRVDAGRWINDIKRLQEYMRHGRLPEAERLAKSLIDAEPRLPEPNAIMGDIMLARGNRPRAAEFYSYASQNDPGNREYMDKYEMALAAVKTVDVSTGRQGEKVTRTVYVEQVFAPGPIAVAIGCIAAAAAYVCLSSHPAMLPKLPLISTWSAGLLGMLAVMGFALGAGLSMSKLVDQFALHAGSGAAKFAPGAILGFIALLNFWVAALIYSVGGSINKAFHQSTTRFIVGVGLCTLLATGAASVTKDIDPLQTFLWGGNIIYLAGLGGWLIADTFRQG